jgi:hypothetical protein
MKILKIEQLETTKDLTHVDITHEELDTIEQLESSQVILQEDEGSFIVGLFTDEYISTMTSIFKKYEIKFRIIDVTSQYVKTSIISMFKSQEDRIKSFIINNVSIDDVLDKINESGMSSLNEMDYIVLNK